MVTVFQVVALAACLVAPAAAKGEDDLVSPVPGLIFNTNFKVYSGYLAGNANGSYQLHYMLTESRTDPANDPLLFWFNGGPGCSSFSGSFEELGPFYINQDNSTLYENIYSWNQHANVLYLESPVGTGFSYNTDNPGDFKASDDETLQQNIFALKDFFTNVQPKYANKTFYLSGESYAGIYLPMLGAAIATDPAFPAQLSGIAIGNGFMNVKMLTNSLILWSFYHGRISLQDWNTLKTDACCNKPAGKDFDDCDWTGNLKTTNNIDYGGDMSTACGRILNNIVNASGIYNIDPYNYYEDCYQQKFITFFDQKDTHSKWKANKINSQNYVHNQADLINRDSTDFLWGYPCSQEIYVAGYFNKKPVQDAFHINPKWQQANIQFGDCNNNLYNSYKLTYPDMSDRFDTMIKNLKNFHILIYNGDVDTVCNFLGDAKFIDKVASDHGFNSTARQRWNFRNQTAGFYQRYAGASNFVIDVLTVKGAGHMVPMDRPGPSLQMITNFLKSTTPDYNNGQVINAVPTPGFLITAPTVTSPTTTSPTTTTTTSAASSRGGFSMLAGVVASALFMLLSF